MQDNIPALYTDSSKTSLQDLARELSIDIEALEERLEMVAINPILCCSFNSGCTIHPD